MVSESDLILVCVLPAPRDLEIARLLGWYRIPLRRAPKVVAVDYLAFYQPASFGEQGGQIQYLAKVHGHELITRAELLRDELDHSRAGEEYYKIQIGDLERLARPILARTWKRLTFLYTIGEYLLQARTLNDLVVHSEERQMLWKALRERAAQEQTYKVDLPDVDIDPVILAQFLGIKEPKESYELAEDEW